MNGKTFSADNYFNEAADSQIVHWHYTVRHVVISLLSNITTCLTVKKPVMITSKSNHFVIVSP